MLRRQLVALAIRFIILVANYIYDIVVSDNSIRMVVLVGIPFLAIHLRSSAPGPFLGGRLPSLRRCPLLRWLRRTLGGRLQLRRPRDALLLYGRAFVNLRVEDVDRHAPAKMRHVVLREVERRSD